MDELWRTSTSQSWAAHLPCAGMEGAGTASASHPLAGTESLSSLFAEQAVIPHFLQVEVSPGLHLAYQL